VLQVRELPASSMRHDAQIRIIPPSIPDGAPRSVIRRRLIGVLDGTLVRLGEALARHSHRQVGVSRLSLAGGTAEREGEREIGKEAEASAQTEMPFSFAAGRASSRDYLLAASERRREKRARAHASSKSERFHFPGLLEAATAVGDRQRGRQ